MLAAKRPRKRHPVVASLLPSERERERVLGRPRDFDETEVLAQATELFWQRGYDATSLSDLLDHMGISRQSLYNTFGGKEQLFHRALEHYIENRLAPMLAGMEAPGADLRSIETHFDVVARETTIPGATRKGCLMTNTLVELASQDVEVGKLMRRFRARLENAYLNALRGAEQAGQLKAQLSLEGAAKFLATLDQGMAVVSKSGVSRRQQQSTARLALEAIRA